MTLGALIAAARTLAPDARARVEQSGRQTAAVATVAHDSRAVSPGSVFVAIRGQRADGAKFAADAVKRGAVAIVAESAAPGRLPGAVDQDDGRAPRARGAGRHLLRPAERLAHGRRRHRHERQDHDHLPAGVGLRRRRDAVRADWHRDVPHRIGRGRRARRVAHDAGSIRNPAAPPGDGRSRLQGVRDGSLVARARAAPRGQHAVRRRDFHQPDPRPSRFSRRHGAVLRRQAPAVRDAAGRRAGDRQRGRSQGRGARRLAPARDDLRDRSAGRRSGDPPALVARRPGVYRRDPARDDRHAIAARRPSERLQHPRRRRGRKRARPSSPRDRRGHRAARARARAVPDRVGLDRRRPRGRRLRAHRRRAQEPARDGAAAQPRPAHHGVRMRRRSRSHQAAADGRRRGPAERLRRADLRQPALGGSAIGSSTRSSSGCRRRRSRARRSVTRRRSSTNPDRRLAIEQAIRSAKPGDLVIIAGKGHEKYQVIGDRTLPFDDVEVARAALGQRRAASKV